MEVGTVILSRNSPRGYTHDPISRDVILDIFSHARWAQSSFNEQPWSFLLTTREDGEARQKMESYLAEGNAFAKEAWVLGISFAKKTFQKNGAINRHCWHDVGATSQLVALRAWNLGINTRFMAGFDHVKAAELCPDDYEPVAMFVMGIATDAAKTVASQNRGRREVETFVFTGQWGVPFKK